MKAEKGDLIRIVNGDGYQPYKNGDILEVVSGHDFGEASVKLLGSDVPVLVYAKEYEIFRKAGEEDEVDGIFESYIRTYDEPKPVINDVNVTQDAVNHPNHYTKGRVEVIDVIEDAVDGADPFEAVCQANVLKYMLRYRHKNGVEDVKKAVWYANKLIEHLERN